MPEGNPLGSILILLLLIGCNAFFAMSEIAVISFNDAKLKHLADQGDKRAGILHKLTSQPSKFLATIQVGVTLSGFFASAIAADTFSEYIVYFFQSYLKLPVSPDIIKTVSIIFITLMLSYLTLVFGELVPKRIGMNNPEKISFGIARIIRVVYIVTKPFVWLLSASTNGILRLLKINPDQSEPEVTEEEIRMMIDVGEEEGAIELSEKEMIHNIFDFDNREACEVMTHRTEIEALDISTSLGDTVAKATQTGHSRLPVCDGGLDNIIGVIYIKDLLRFVVGNGDDFKISDYKRDVMFVPESARCRDIFNEFRRTRLQFAVVVDEYGGTAGIVTMEDILESIVGNIQDEYDNEDADIVPTVNGEFQLLGTALLDDVSEALDTRFFDAGDYDTIAGYLVDKLGRLPSDDERPTLEAHGWLFSVTETAEHRIVRILAKKLPPTEIPQA
ncbi:MAG: hemolysin family protein [Oscillospiraceae bacterium]